MIKQTLYFGNPVFLSLRDKQLVIKYPELEMANAAAKSPIDGYPITRPIEDIGVVILDHQQITITHALVGALVDNNVAIVTCDKKSMPTGLLLNLNGNTEQSEKFRSQINASAPLKKNLWQQTVRAKITNQAYALENVAGIKASNLKAWIPDIKSGDPDNYEARAAAFYWRNFFSKLIPDFRRGREENPPNNLLNYGYAILRAVIARNLVGSGLLPTLGIHHRSKYNAYCLADDIMEPYRPIVDIMVYKIVSSGKDYSPLTTELKRELLAIPSVDVNILDKRSPLLVGAARTTASLARCFSGESRQIAYPTIEND